MPPRLFTLAEATAELPRVRGLVERLVEQRAEQLAIRARIGGLAARVGGNGGGISPGAPAELARQAAAADEALRDTLTAIGALGVIVKDADAGLVDFPSLRDGVPVFLCWQLGEDEIAYWHGLEEGFAGRKPV
ncbi:MAG TPA: DUF2203 domain-containing protein [Gaiellaceae bacterium]|nr:DUF2203 domain-containing protein [Gaiellaceae bacterium]